VTKFGNYLSNAVTPIGEKIVVVGPEVYLAQNDNFFAVGSFTMPCAGHLFFDIWAELEWASGILPQTWLSVATTSTPAPTSLADFGVAHYATGAFTAAHEPRSHAWWQNLSAGATVSVNARLSTNIGGVVLVHFIGGFWRPMAT
jgi:hypothetical protein